MGQDGACRSYSGGGCHAWGAGCRNPKTSGKSWKTSEVSSKPHFASGQRYLRGLFSGGTLCYEAQVIWRDLLPEPVLSNAPLEAANQLPDSLHSQGHTVVDLGEEEFTVGRPHPMIDNDLRIRRLLQEAQDPQVAVIMLDVVLGYGAHPDPASELAPAVQKARELRHAAGGELLVVASVTGTDGDPQGLSRQVSLLEQAGVIVCESNAAAARLVAKVIERAMTEKKINDLFGKPLNIVNLGLSSMAQSVREQGVPVVEVDWRPPAEGVPRLRVTRSRHRYRGR